MPRSRVSFGLAGVRCLCNSLRAGGARPLILGPSSPCSENRHFGRRKPSCGGSLHVFSLSLFLSFFVPPRSNMGQASASSGTPRERCARRHGLPLGHARRTDNRSCVPGRRSAKHVRHPWRTMANMGERQTSASGARCRAQQGHLKLIWSPYAWGSMWPEPRAVALAGPMQLRRRARRSSQRGSSRRVGLAKTARGHPKDLSPPSDSQSPQLGEDQRSEDTIALDRATPLCLGMDLTTGTETPTDRLRVGHGGMPSVSCARAADSAPPTSE